jgi:hypothetical protein
MAEERNEKKEQRKSGSKEKEQTERCKNRM